MYDVGGFYSHSDATLMVVQVSDVLIHLTCDEDVLLTCDEDVLLTCAVAHNWMHLRRKKGNERVKEREGRWRKLYLALSSHPLVCLRKPSSL